MASMTFGPGDGYVGWVSTYNGTVQTDADTLPVATFYHSGALDASVTLVVTKVATGLYRTTGTIPTSGYAVGDACMVRTVATVGGVTGDKTDVFRLDTLTSSVAAAVWNSLLASYSTASTFGNKFRTWILGTDFKAILSTDTQPTLSVNTTQLAGQTVTAASGVTFPSTVGNSTYAGGNVTVGGYATNQDPATIVWGAATRTLSAFNFTPTVGGYSTGQDPATLVWAAGTRTLSTLNGLTPQIGFFANQPAYPTSPSVPTAQANADALMASSVETGVTFVQAMRAVAAVAAGKKTTNGWAGIGVSTERVSSTDDRETVTLNLG
jgi:hypothetical protein